MARAIEQKPSPILEALRRLRADAASYRGIWSWITTVDHKRIGIMYGGIFMNASFFTGGNILQGELGAPDAGWFGYAPLTLNRFSPGEGVDFWALGLLILGVASMASGFNFIVTILNMRAPCRP